MSNHNEEKRYCNKARTNECVVGQVKQPLSEFNRAKHTRTGLQSICRSCMKKNGKKHRDKVKEQKAWLHEFIIG